MDPRLLGAAFVLALLGTGTLSAQTLTPAAGAAPPRPAAAGAAAAPRVTRPPLFFREEWKQNTKGGEHGVEPGSVGNTDLELHMHIPAGEILLTGNAGDENNPIHLWTGMCSRPALRRCAARRSSPI